MRNSFFHVVFVCCFIENVLANQSYVLRTAHRIGVSEKGKSIHLGGFSGLYFLGMNAATGEYQFLSHTDRGPNLNPLIETKDGRTMRPYPLASFTPEWFVLETNKKEKSLKVLKRVKLKTKQGSFLRGVPFRSRDRDSDEWLTTESGKPIAASFLGVDLEGITKDSEGNIWMCEEYLPSILKFSDKGILLKRYVPIGSLNDQEKVSVEEVLGKNVIKEILPAELTSKQINRGFEGITWFKGRIYAAMQSSLRQSKKQTIPILELNPLTEIITAEYEYPLLQPGVDKIGDMSSSSDKIFLIEQNSVNGAEAVRKIYEVNNFSSRLLKKTLVKDLKNSDAKLEGLALTSENKIFVINDNDFQINSDTNPQTILQLIE
ncbi:MAG: esterase-like activity of phytase family protein [Pseudomonadota bacterium]|nr:esterase-like activity of phytase family protein [Pseudomonadota bacterium]